jgi:hypothetical protein
MITLLLRPDGGPIQVWALLVIMGTPIGAVLGTIFAPHRKKPE